MGASILVVPSIGNAISDTYLVSWWSCDETSGVRNDSHGTNHLTDNNTVGYTTGKVGNACDFEATNSEYLSILDAGVDSDLDFTDSNISIALWMNRETDIAAAIVSKFDGNGGASDRQYALYPEANTGTDMSGIVSNGTVANWKYWTYTFNTATWYHIVYTYDTTNGDCDLYVNGTEQSHLTGCGTSGSYDDTLTFMLGYSINGSYFDGQLDEVSMWSTELVQADVDDLYNAGTGTSYDDLFAATTSTSTATSTATSTDLTVDELVWMLELYLSLFTFLIFTYVGYRFTKLFL